MSDDYPLHELPDAELRELRILEARVRSFIEYMPATPERVLRTPGEFWLLKAQIATNLKILTVIREIQNERTRANNPRASHE